MIRPHRRLRLLWGAFLLLYLGYCIYMLLFVSMRNFYRFDRSPDALEFFMFALTVTVFLHGVFRVSIHNPFQNKPYRNFLRSIPWQIDKPLPTGRLYPGWGDVLLLLGLMVLSWVHGLPYVHLFLVMCTGYCIAIIPLFMFHSPRIPLYSWIFAILLFVTLMFIKADVTPYYIFFLMPLFLLAMTLLTLQRLFQALPYTLEFEDYEYVADMFSPNKTIMAPDGKRATRPEYVGWIRRSAGRSQETLGYPLSALVPLPVHPIFRQRDVWLLSFISGWIVGLTVLGSTHLGDAHTPIIFVSLFLIVYRTGAYSGYKKPPISWKGRILTGRWIIPKFDRIFIPSLTAIATYIVLFRSLMHLGVPSCIACGFGYGVAVFLLLTTGPSLNKQHLTGAFQLTRKMPKGVNINKAN